MSRLLRCEDSAANSIVAGAATGATLLGLQREACISQSYECAATETNYTPAFTSMPLSMFVPVLLTSPVTLNVASVGGKAASLPAALVCGAAAGTLHVLDDAMQPLPAFRQWLMEYGLLDTGEHMLDAIKNFIL